MAAAILSYNGGAVVAMLGKNCVAIASDTRYGVQAQLISTNRQKIFQVGSHTFVGIPGLVTDGQTIVEILKFRTNLYKLREDRPVRPSVLAKMLVNILYEKRFTPFFSEPVVAGIDYKTKEPYICNMDLIGCINESKDFVVGGTSSNQLYGMCEALWRPDKGPEELFEIISQALLNAVDRDAFSGWGAIVYVVEPDKLSIRKLKTRMD